MSKRYSLKESEVTPRHIYMNRRQLMQAAAAFGISGPLWAQNSWLKRVLASDDFNLTYTTDEEIAPKAVATSHNNFYEFGLGKSDPAKQAKNFDTSDWRVEVTGLCDKPGILDLDDLINPSLIEERIYRLRCVEAWSMVIPWMGIELSQLLKRFEPNSNAKYVAFTTLYDPKQMPGQRSASSFIDYPYVEGLRIDEAMHPLTLMAVGMYGEALPNQNGAPIRLVVPWKYGFKSIKSIVKIEFTDKQPPTTWNLTAPREYGFYANVNPNVDHPRWSQAEETRLPSSFFSPNRIPTQMFNGYADEVASLYTGLDLRRNF